MNKLCAWLFAAALVIGFWSVPTLTYADQHEKDPVEEAEEGSDADSDDKKDDSKEGE